MSSTQVSSFPALTLLLRRFGSLALFTLALIVVPALAEDLTLRSVVPGFLALLYLQLAPALWSRKTDLFAPPVYTGIMGGMATLATLAYFFADGRIDIPLVSGLAPDELADLARTTLIASCLGQACYYAGYYHPTWGRFWARLYPRVRAAAWDGTRLRIAAGVMVLVFIACYGFFQVRLGVPVFDVTALRGGKAVWRDDPTLSWMLRGVQLGALPVLFYLALSAASTSWRRFFLWLGALLAVGLLQLRIGQRGFLFGPLLAGLCVIHFLRKRIRPSLFVAALFVGIVANSVFLGWREGQSDGSTDFQTVTNTPALEVFATHENERQRFAALALLFHEFPQHHDFLLGETWLAIITAPIPRWLWPDKRDLFLWRDTGIVMNLVGVPIPTGYLGALYANFSWIGIVLGMILWGAIHRGLYEWLIIDPRNPGRVLLYTMLLLFFGLTLLQLSATVQWVLATWVVLRYIASRKRVAAAPATT